MIKRFDMSKPRKVCVVITNRASYGRVKSMMKAINEHPELKLQLVVTSSTLIEKYGNADKLIERDGFEINERVYCQLEGATPETNAKTTGLAIIELSSIFARLQPDFTVTVADRFETIATAIAATFTNHPLVHIQGGDVSGNIDDSVRHSITKLAHIHFPCTKLSAQRIIQMGEDPSHVHNVGCSAIDAISQIDLSIPYKFIDTMGGSGAILDFKKPYVVLSQHSVTSEYEYAEQQITESLYAIEKLKANAVILWPNPDSGSDGVSKGIRVFKEKFKDDERFHYVRNLSVENYAILIKNCSCLIGNSSSGLREGSFLGVPTINIGNRQRGRECDNNIYNVVEHDRNKIHEAIKIMIKKGNKLKSSDLFGDGTAGQKMADILSQYSELSLQKTFNLI